MQINKASKMMPAMAPPGTPPIAAGVQKVPELDEEGDDDDEGPE
jgi:hypothetical protein